MGNIQILPDYFLPIKNRVLLEIFGVGMVVYLLPNEYDHHYLHQILIKFDLESKYLTMKIHPNV